MSRIVALEAQERSLVGKGAARALRRSDFIPAIIYGGGKNEVMISLPKKEISLLYNKHGFFSHLYEVTVGKNKFKVIPKDVQLNAVTDFIEHIDFIHVDASAKVTVHVELNFTNKAKCVGIKRGGILNIPHMSIDLLCDPLHIPETLEVDIANLDIGDAIHVKDLKLPKGVEAVAADSYTVCGIVGATAEVEEDTVADAGEAEKEEKK